MSKPALIVIDVQSDYFEGGAYPLWNTEQTLAATEKAIHAARAKGIPVVLVQHTGEASSPFFRPDTRGSRIHDRVCFAAGDAPIVIKRHADAFHETVLHDTLQGLQADELILCGMMTQNCVTHTAISRRADEYRKVMVLKDACTTVTELLHLIALNGMAPRVPLASTSEVFA